MARSRRAIRTSRSCCPACAIVMEGSGAATVAPRTPTSRAPGTSSRRPRATSIRATQPRRSRGGGGRLRVPLELQLQLRLLPRRHRPAAAEEGRAGERRSELGRRRRREQREPPPPSHLPRRCRSALRRRRRCHWRAPRAEMPPWEPSAGSTPAAATSPTSTTWGCSCAAQGTAAAVPSRR